MEERRWIDPLLLVATAGIGGLGVVAGALGAHPPDGFLQEAAQRDAWNSASIFLLFHVLAVLGMGDLRNRSLPPFRLSALLFIIGILLFSGSIFILSAGGPRFLGPVTPLGGLFLIGGWVSFGIQLLRGKRVRPKDFVE